MKSIKRESNIVRVFITSVIGLLIITLSVSCKVKTETKAEDKYRGRVISYAERKLQSGTGSITIDVSLPPGYELTDEAPSRVAWKSGNSGSIRLDIDNDGDVREDVMFPIDIPYQANEGESDLVFDLRVFVCEKETRVCVKDEVRIMVPVSIDPNGRNQLNINYDPQLPDGRFDL